MDVIGEHRGLINSNAPERSRGLRVRCARSGTNGERWVRLFENLTKVLGDDKLSMIMGKW